MLSRRSIIAILLIVASAFLFWLWVGARYESSVGEPVPVLLSGAATSKYAAAESLPGSKDGFNARVASGVTSVTSALSWRNVVGNRDTEWALKQLRISTDPNDLFRAATLARLCAGTAGVSLESAKQALGETRLGASTREAVVTMLEQARLRCSGSMEVWTSHEYLGGLIALAKQRGAALATAPRLTSAKLASGLSLDEASSLQSVLTSPDLRSPWIAANHSELERAIRSSPEFATLTSAEVTAAVFLVLCSAGDDCGSDSLYRPYLCIASLFEMCGADRVEASARQVVLAARVSLFDERLQKLESAIATGDLATLGLTKAR